MSHYQPKHKLTKTDRAIIYLTEWQHRNCHCACVCKCRLPSIRMIIRDAVVSQGTAATARTRFMRGGDCGSHYRPSATS